MGAERERLVLATKFTLNLHPDDINSGGNQRKNIRQSLEASLKRLKTDYIDLYWLHVWDRVTPIEEVMRTLDDLVQAGKILYVGVSDAPGMADLARQYDGRIAGLGAFFTAMQMEYSLIERGPERELFPNGRGLGCRDDSLVASGNGSSDWKIQSHPGPKSPQAARQNGWKLLLISTSARAISPLRKRCKRWLRSAGKALRRPPHRLGRCRRAISIPRLSCARKMSTSSKII